MTSYRPIELKIYNRINQKWSNLPFLFLKDLIRKRGSKKLYLRYERDNPGHYYSLAAFDYYECLFIHIPKTGGLSILHELFGNAGGFHTSMREYQNIFAPSTLEQYHKFTFVRNPFDRLVSAFFYMKGGGMHQEDAKWANQHIGMYDTFSEFVMNWVNEENVRKGIHFIPQVDFIKDKSGEINIDFIGKFENIETDFIKISNQLGLKNKSLSHENKSKRKRDYKTYYDSKLIDIVSKAYEEDLSKLKYSFE